jgi:type IV pilus assembly protein PilW
MNFNTQKNSSGMTLVELLVAMVVGMVLLGGVYVSFTSSTTTNSMNEQLSRIQENGRFATSLLTGEVRDAGYVGCLNDVTSFKNVLAPFDPSNPDTVESFLYDFSSALHGFEANGDGTWNDGNEDDENFTWNELNTQFALDFTKEPDQLSDILVIRGMDTSSIVLDVVPSAASADMKVAGTAEELDTIEDFDVLLVSDCRHAAVFQVTNYNDDGNMVHNTGTVSFGPGNYTKLLEHPDGKFEEGSIFKPVTSVYFIRINSNDIPSLYKSLPGLDSTVEIAEGVESMQIRYGEDTSDDRIADVYVSADAVTDWENVVSVRIGLLLRSIDELLHGEVDDSDYDIDGDGVTDFTAPGDRHLRVVMSATVGIRNRLP